MFAKMTLGSGDGTLVEVEACIEDTECAPLVSLEDLLSQVIKAGLAGYAGLPDVE